MLTFDQLNTLPNTIVDIYEEYLQSVINDIARRIAKMGVTPTAAWQMQRYIESGGVYENALKQLAKITGKSEKALLEAMKRAGVQSMKFDDSIYRAAGLDPIPLNLSPAMQQVLLAGLKKTDMTLRNLVSTTAITAQASFIEASDMAYMQVSSGAMDYNSAIRAAIKQVADSGLATIDYKTGHRDQIDVAVRRAVLTGVSQTAGVVQIQRMDEMGVDLVQTSAHAGARNKGVGPQNHESWQGRIFSRSGKSKKYPPFVETTGYGTGEGLMGWNCVVGETLVSGPAIRAAYRRKYSGEVVVVHTANGKELTVTPNHPILSDFGWISAGALNEGDYIIESADGDGMDGVGPNINKNISSIADIFNALSVELEVFRFPVSPGDFHGDVGNGEVDVIFTDGLLGNTRKVRLGEHVEKHILGDAGGLCKSLPSLGASCKILERFFGSPDRIICGSCKAGPSVCTNSGEPIGHCLGSITSNGYSKFFEIDAYRTLGNSSFGGNFAFAHTGVIHSKNVIGGNPVGSFDISLPIVPGINALADKKILDRMSRAAVLVSNELHGMVRHIQLDNIVGIERKSTQSSFIHVYNLHTEGEWYSANGIITHNCRHSFYPYYEGLSENAYTARDRKSLANQKVEYNGEKISMYDATQLQRYIERNIRRWKRQAWALEAAGLDNSQETELVKKWQVRMRDFINQTNLNRQSIREQI